MDYITDKKTNITKYEIIAAMVFEQALYLDMSKHSMIHLFGALPGYEEKGYMEDLLFRVGKRTNLKAKNLIFINQYGKYDYQIRHFDDCNSEVEQFGIVTPLNIFLNMNFTSKMHSKKLKVAIGEMIPKHSQYVYGSGEIATGECRKVSKNRSKTAKICYTHANVKFAASYNTQNETFDLYSHPFGWDTSTTESLQYIASKFKKICIDNPGKKVRLGGGGHRPESVTRKLMKSDVVTKLPDQFIQRSQSSKNNCVWLSMVLLLGWSDKELGAKMIKMMEINPEQYQWMFMTKIPKRFKDICDENNCVTLQQALQDKEVNYKLVSINFKKLNMTYIKHIMDEKTTGKFICQIEAKGGDRFHTISIDCDSNPKMILDPCKRWALKLSMRNLDYCCGKYLLGIKKIYLCYKFIPN